MEIKLKFIMSLLYTKVIIFMDTVAIVAEYGKPKKERIVMKYFKQTQY